MINKKKFGLECELRAIKILKNNGFKIIEHTSKKKPFCIYDIIVKKEGIIYFVEVKGSISKRKFFNIGESKMKNLMYLDNVILFLICKDEYIMINYEDLDNKKKLKGFNLYLGVNLKELLEEKRTIQEIENQLNSYFENNKRKLIIRFAGFLGIRFSKEEEEVYNIKEGDIVEFAEFDIIETKNIKKRKK